MMPAGPDTMERSVCVCVGGNGMFNTISKHCLLCLRLVSDGAPLLQSGFIRGGVDWLCLCATQLLLPLLILLGRSVRFGWGVSVLLRSEAAAIHVCDCVLSPGEGAGFVFIQSHRMTQETSPPDHSRVAPMRHRSKMHILHKQNTKDSYS